MIGRIALYLALAAATAAGLAAPARAQAPIEGELTLITPVSKFIHDAALKAFADYAKEKWNVTVKVSAIPAGTPVAYGRIVEWKGRPEVDIFWGGESALFADLADKRLLQKVEISREAGYSIGFFMFWAATLSASAFTALLLAREPSRRRGAEDEDE